MSPACKGTLAPLKIGLAPAEPRAMVGAARVFAAGARTRKEAPWTSEETCGVKLAVIASPVPAPTETSGWPLIWASNEATCEAFTVEVTPAWTSGIRAFGSSKPIGGNALMVESAIVLGP